MIIRCDTFGNMDVVPKINYIKDMRDLGVPSLTYSEDDKKILLSVTDWGDAYMVFDYRKHLEDVDIRRVKK